MYPKAVAGAALPFTGLILGWKVVAAAALVLAGMALLRMSLVDKAKASLRPGTPGTRRSWPRIHAAQSGSGIVHVEPTPGYCGRDARR